MIRNSCGLGGGDVKVCPREIVARASWLKACLQSTSNMHIRACAQEKTVLWMR